MEVLLKDESAHNGQSDSLYRVLTLTAKLIWTPERRKLS